MRLKTIYREGHPWPNGGYPFTDGRTGMRFEAMSADLKLQAENVIKHRRANAHIYPADQPKYTDKDWVMAEIEDFMCKQKPEICGADNEPAVGDPTLQVATPEQDCPTCGAREWLPMWCQTCGQPKILAFKCAKCATKL